MTDPTRNPDDRTPSTRADDEIDVQRRSDADTRTQHAAQRPVVPPSSTNEDSLVRDRPRERNDATDRLRGIRWGAVFFGWLCATGVAVLLVAIVAATGTAVGLSESSVDEVVDGAVGNAGAVSLGGALALVLVLALSYLAGGYVAARMARFSGRSQGFAVWVVGLVVTLLVALGGVVLGSAYDVFARLDLPRIPVDEDTVTTGGVLTLLAVLIVTLLAAVLGGAFGDRYHRRLDQIDLR